MERYGKNDYELYTSKNVCDDSWIKAVFCFVFLICFFASFGSFFLHSFSLVRWCYSGPTQALWSTFIFTVFLPRHSFSAIMEGKFFSPEGVVTS